MNWRNACIAGGIVALFVAATYFYRGMTTEFIDGYRWFIIQTGAASKSISDIRLVSDDTDRFVFEVRYHGSFRSRKYAVEKNQIGILIPDKQVPLEVADKLGLPNFFFKGCGKWADEKLTFEQAIINKSIPIEQRDQALLRKYRILASCHYDYFGYNP